eukprot:7386760-Prymnesium_polylepis.1
MHAVRHDAPLAQQAGGVEDLGVAAARMQRRHEGHLIVRFRAVRLDPAAALAIRRDEPPEAAQQLVRARRDEARRDRGVDQPASRVGR